MLFFVVMTLAIFTVIIMRFFKIIVSLRLNVLDVFNLLQIQNTFLVPEYVAYYSNQILKCTGQYFHLHNSTYLLFVFL